MDIESTLSGHNLAFLEALYEAYKRDPNSVDPEWLPCWRRPRARSQAGGPADVDERRGEQIALQGLVDKLIESYRLHGHMAAELDPLGARARAPWPGLDPAYFGLARAHGPSFAPGDADARADGDAARDLSHLRNTYCRNVGVEYWHIPDLEQRTWLQARMEGCENKVPSAAEQKRLLQQMAGIDSVDKFLHSRFLGAKRFSIAGAEAMIALLDCIIEEGAELGVDEIIIGMAHRGRLNVLMNILGKAAPTSSPSSARATRGRAWAPAT
jgi:2-oxoglutarate dehydrogenase E1 component